MTDAWELVRREREALVEDLAGLSDEQWELPSLCSGWTVHDVAAHLVDNARTTRLGIVAAMVRARFDFDRQNDAGIAREKGATPADTLDRLRAVVGRRRACGGCRRPPPALCGGRAQLGAHPSRACGGRLWLVGRPDPRAPCRRPLPPRVAGASLVSAPR